MMRAILTVIGTRPQFIKAGAVSQALRTRSNLREIIVHTGQHFDDNMSRQFFDELDIPTPEIFPGYPRRSARRNDGPDATRNRARHWRSAA